MEPRYQALLIGNSTFPGYPDNLPSLDGPANDVMALAAALTDREAGLFDRGQVRIALERTAAEILDEIATFLGDARRQDRLFLSYRGHGVLDHENHLFLAGADTRIDQLRSTALDTAIIRRLIDDSAAESTVIALDCFHGQVFQGGVDLEVLAGPRRFVLTSSPSARPKGTRTFTQHLVEGLLGEASDHDGDGLVDVADLYRYAHEKLEAETGQTPLRRFAGPGDAVLSRRPPRTPAAPPRLRAEAGSPHHHALDEDVQFTVYRPQAVPADRWHSMLVFAHKSEPFVDDLLGPVDPLAEVRRQAAQHLGDDADRYQPVASDSSQALAWGSELRLVPEMDGVVFNPPSRTFLWVEPVHQEEFRFRASSGLEGHHARGALSVYFGTLLIAEVRLSIRIGPGDATLVIAERGRPYRKIFASYSRRDVAVVRQVEAFVSTYGDRFLRDATDLRSGEVWSDGLAAMIREADIFQLFWSTSSMTSPFVSQEWTYALGLARPNFIRPTYWEDPMPARPEDDLPPVALARLHFSRLMLPGPAEARPVAPPVPPPLRVDSPPGSADAPTRPPPPPAQPSRVGARRSRSIRRLATVGAVAAAGAAYLASVPGAPMGSPPGAELALPPPVLAKPFTPMTSTTMTGTSRTSTAVTGPPPPPSTTAGTVPGAGTVPVPLQDLLDLVPVGLRRRCGEPRPAAFNGRYPGLVCAAGAAVNVAYYQLPDLTSMNASFRTIVRQEGLDPDTCDPAAGATFRSSERFRAAGAEVGSVGCYTDSDGNPWIVWTNDVLRIFSYAVSTGPVDVERRKVELYGLWRGAGPG